MQIIVYHVIILQEVEKCSSSSIYWYRNTFFQTPHKGSSQDASKLMFNRTISVCDLLSWKKETVQYVACIGHVETIMY